MRSASSLSRVLSTGRHFQPIWINTKSTSHVHQADTPQRALMLSNVWWCQFCVYILGGHIMTLQFPFPDFRVFLLRDSQSNPKTFVLSLCHMQRIKHFQIVPVSSPTHVPQLQQRLVPLTLSVFLPADGWRRGGAPQSGRRPHTLHGPDSAGGVLPTQLWGAALQTQTPLHPDHPVSPEPPEIPV